MLGKLSAKKLSFFERYLPEYKKNSYLALNKTIFEKSKNGQMNGIHRFIQAARVSCTVYSSDTDCTLYRENRDSTPNE